MTTELLIQKQDKAAFENAARDIKVSIVKETPEELFVRYTVEFDSPHNLYYLGSCKEIHTNILKIAETINKL